STIACRGDRSRPRGGKDRVTDTPGVPSPYLALVCFAAERTSFSLWFAANLPALRRIFTFMTSPPFTPIVGQGQRWGEATSTLTWKNPAPRDGLSPWLGSFGLRYKKNGPPLPARRPGAGAMPGR